MISDVARRALDSIRVALVCGKLETLNAATLDATADGATTKKNAHS